MRSNGNIRVAGVLRIARGLIVLVSGMSLLLSMHSAHAIDVNTLRAQQDCVGREPGAKPTGMINNCTAFGSGFFVSAHGHILTSAHVVDGCSRIAVRSSERTIYLSHVIARDPDYDIAVIQINGGVPAVAVLSEAAPSVAQSMVAIGFPEERDTTKGPNGARGEILNTSNYTRDQRLLAFSAPVSKGNSGGPVIDNRGNVVGIVYGRYNEVPGVFFAVRATAAMRLLDRQGIKYRILSGSVPPDAIEIGALIRHAARYTVFVQCLS